MITFDDVLRDIGEFGRCQKWIVLLLSLCGVTFSFITAVFGFLGVIPSHWCRGSPAVVGLRERCGWSLEEERNYTVPPAKSGSPVYSQCESYDIDWNLTYLSCDYPEALIANSSGEVLRTTCKDGWFFDSSRTTIVSEYDLVCDDAWKVDLSRGCIQIGFSLGVLITGYAADRFGRKLSLLACLGGTGVAGIFVALAPVYPMFVIFRILQGLFGRGISVITAVIATEMVGCRHRRLVIVVTQTMFSLGVMLLPGFAYVIKSWKGIQMAVTVPNFVLLLYCCLIPESPRWLLSRKRLKEALKVAQEMADQNGKSLPSTYKELRKHNLPQAMMVQFYTAIVESVLTFSIMVCFGSATKHDIRRLQRSAAKMMMAESSPEVVKHPSFLDLFRTAQMRRRTLILMYCWFTSGLVYLGLTLRLGLQGVENYGDTFVAGAVELPATMLGLLVVRRVGRRSPFLASSVLAAAFCLIAACISGEMPRLKTAVTTLARFGITISLSILFLVTNELQPTSIRSFGVSVCLSLSDISGLAAPLVLYKLAAVWTELPLVIFGALALVAGGLMMLLPETRGLRLPENIKDVENIGRLYRHDQDECKEMINLRAST